MDPDANFFNFHIEGDLVMKKINEELLDEIGDRVLTMPIEVLWKSQDITVRVGERRGISRGSNGYQIISRQPYEMGDDPRNIDHFASAQSADDSIITIKYQEPHDINIVAVVDTGKRMLFGTRRADKRTVSAEVVASILACAHKTQDRAKVITFSEQQVESRVGPRGPRSVFAPAMEAILEPPQSAPAPAEKTEGSDLLKVLGSFRRKSASRKTDVPLASGKCEALLEVPRTRSLIFFISDFINLSEAEKESLRDAAVVHDVVCIVIRDLREHELPSGRGMYTLRDIVSGEAKSVWLNESNREQFRQNAQKRLDELTAFFTDADCDWGLFSTEQDADEVIPEMMRLFSGHRR
jgi:uncharacterized protein (DUF58 family)